MTSVEFASKWARSERTERGAAQEHFIDLCRLLGEPTPNTADPIGEFYAFEKGARKIGDGDGFADVWKRGCFAWEYKGKRKNLEEAYRQLLKYREALENPPLLVVCDLDRFEVHTNFTGTKKAAYSFSLKDLRDKPEEPLRVLRALFKEPYSLKPAETRAKVTEDAAARFVELAGRLQSRGIDPQKVAHFLNQLLFCFFAEDVGLLPRNVLSRLVENTQLFPKFFPAQLAELFRKMAKEGGFFGAERIEWFNGGLFAEHDVLPLDREDLKVVLEASKLDWSSIEPAILGTLFERGLDPAKRRQIGAHYTDMDSILRVVEPVVLVPLRREFDAMKARASALLAEGKRVTKRTPPDKDPRRVFDSFLDRLRSLRILDPACGSGNFLSVALKLVMDLEKEALLWASEVFQKPIEFPRVGPEIVHGVEINAFAKQLAEVAVWVGHLQWMIGNGFGHERDPILRPLDTIECRDAILDRSGKKPRRADWPDADFVIGNPPFLGGKKLRTGLGDDYVRDLFAAWEGEVPREADLACYWHEKARAMIEAGRVKRAGLLATQGIRSGANRQVLARIKESGDIFAAWSDEPWVVEGADVRVSIVAQDDGSECERRLDGRRVDVIHSDLSGGGAGAVDLTQARPLAENAGLAFMGDTKGGAFEIDGETAHRMLGAPVNPNSRRNSDVVVPWINGLDLVRRPRGKFIIDFGTDMSREDAALYEAPFEHVAKRVKPKRETSRTTIEQWWLHERPRPEMRAAIAHLSRYIVTARNARHRAFLWSTRPTLPDSQVIVVARDDDFTLGVLQSKAHMTWSLRKGSRLGVGNDPRYTPTSTFETFPFPWPLATPDDALTRDQRLARDAVEFAAKTLDQRRRLWLDPPDATDARELAKRTLTELYNQRHDWLVEAHRKLDGAVRVAYGWTDDPSDDEVLRRLLDLNLARAARPA